MALILFPTKSELGRLCNSTLRGSPLCSESLCRGIACDGKLDADEFKILTEIESTILLVNKKVAELIEELPHSDIANAYRYENSFINWRDRSHFIRLCLRLLNRDIDENVVSLMALMELFYLHFLLVDEVLDNHEECEGRKLYYKLQGDEEGKNRTISLVQGLWGVATEVIVDVVKKKSLGVKGFERMITSFAQMHDETYQALYEDAKWIDIDSYYNNQVGKEYLRSIILTEYFNRVTLLWGSHFETGIRLACCVQSDAMDEDAEILAKAGRIWGQMLKLRDDIVDLIGDKEGLGREPFEDVFVSGADKKVKVKRTLPLLLLLEVVPKGKKQCLKDFFEVLKTKGIYEAGGMPEFKATFEAIIKESKLHLQNIAGGIYQVLEKFPDSSGKEAIFKLVSRITRIDVKF